MSRCCPPSLAKRRNCCPRRFWNSPPPDQAAPDLARTPGARGLSRPTPARAPGSRGLVPAWRALGPAAATGSCRIRSRWRMIRWRRDDPGTRPIDDEGVVTQRRVLVERGLLKGALADLEAAARFGIPATGHARQSGNSRTWIGWSNVVMEPGGASAADVVHASGRRSPHSRPAPGGWQSGARERDLDDAVGLQGGEGRDRREVSAICPERGR